jgi:hypothetical protein
VVTKRVVVEIVETVGIMEVVETEAVMGINLVKMLVLHMLSIDDEPLNLILSEAVISEDNKSYIQSPYSVEVVSQDDIKEALKDLERNNLIILLNELGEPLKDKNIEEVLKTNTEWEFWFRITEDGIELFEKNYSSFFSNN